MSFLCPIHLLKYRFKNTLESSAVFQTEFPFPVSAARKSEWHFRRKICFKYFFFLKLDKRYGYYFPGNLNVHNKPYMALKCSEIKTTYCFGSTIALDRYMYMRFQFDSASSGVPYSFIHLIYIHPYPHPPLPTIGCYMR